MDDRKSVVVFESGNLADVHLVSQWLQQGGIRTVVNGETTASAFAGFSAAGLDVAQVLVLESDAETARRLVAEWRRPPNIFTTEGTENTERQKE